VRTCPSIIIAHNHPSNETTASPEDLDVTKSLVQAGEVLGVELLDHLIIAGDKWRSLKTDYLHLF
jgi:DNA repair protein RadC